MYHILKKLFTIGIILFKIIVVVKIALILLFTTTYVNSKTLSQQILNG